LGAFASWSIHWDMPKTAPVAHVDVGATRVIAGAGADVEIV
jgi:hypothetical protein